MANMQIVLASGKNVEAQYVEMMVPLYSYGCENKVKKALANRKGIYSVNVDFHQQKVTVWGICDKQDVLNVVRTKRKGARFWEAGDVVVDQLQDDQSHSDDPSSPQLPRPKRTSGRYLAMIKSRSFNLAMIKSRSFNLDLDRMKGRSLNLKLALKKAFSRSNSI